MNRGSFPIDDRFLGINLDCLVVGAYGRQAVIDSNVAVFLDWATWTDSSMFESLSHFIKGALFLRIHYTRMAGMVRGIQFGCRCCTRYPL